MIADLGLGDFGSFFVRFEGLVRIRLVAFSVSHVSRFPGLSDCFLNQCLCPSVLLIGLFNR